MRGTRGEAGAIRCARLPLVTAAVVAAAAAAVVGCGDEGEQESSTAQTSTTTTRPESAATSEAEGEAPVKLYFLQGEQFKTVDRDLPADGSEASLRAVTTALVDGPTAAERKGKRGAETQIPAGVSVEDVSTEGGKATVELSAGFTEGIPADGGERSDTEEQELDARLAQITYTLTQFDGIDAVAVRSGGVGVEPAIRRSAYAPPAKGPARERHAQGPASFATRALQERLIRLHYLPKGAADGVAGYQTQQAVIAFQSWEGLARDGVVGPLTKAALSDARRPRPRAGGPAKRVEVYRDEGVALLIATGKVKRAIHVSCGGPGTPTPAGSYEVFRKELRSWSVPFQVWLPYASYFNGGIAFHEYPDVPPYPASHGCVRVPAPEAKGLYRFAALGTTVVVI